MMEKVIQFLNANGYIEDSEEGCGYRSFHKNGLSVIDIKHDEIVFVNDYGDWLHLPMNYYALLGALVHHGKKEDYVTV